MSRISTVVLTLAGSVLAASTFLDVRAAHAEADSDWVKASISASRSSNSESASERRASSGRSSRGNTTVARASQPSRLGGPVERETPAPRPSLSGGITWQASAGCVPGQLQGVLSGVVSSFGSIRVTSTCRSVAQNRAAGGASRSYHLSGEAVDFRVLGGSTGAVYAYLASNSSVGGLKHYGGGLFHIDTGPRRPM